MNEAYTIPKLKQAISLLQGIFDLVRVVEPVNTMEVRPGENEGDPLSFKSYSCYAVWRNKTERCLNCISLRALQERERQTKFEFINDEVYSVIAQPIEVEGRALVLEMVNRVYDSVLLGAYGENEFVDMITRYTKRRRVDELTGLFGDEYFKEKLFLRLHQQGDTALCLIDVDGLDRVNEKYGCEVGDMALRAVGQTLGAMFSTVESSVVAKLDGDMFGVMADLDAEAMSKRLKELREKVKRLRFEGYDDMRVSVSMGCARRSELAEGTMGLTALADRRLKAAMRMGPGHIVDTENENEEV